MWMGGRSRGDAIATARLSKSHGAANSRGTPRSRRFRDYGLPRLSVKSTCVVLLFSTCPGDRHLSASTACSSHLSITTLESKVSRFGGRCCNEAHDLRRRLGRVRSLRAPPPCALLPRQAGRWWGFPSCAQQRALASTLLGGTWRAPAQPADTQRS